MRTLLIAVAICAGQLSLAQDIQVVHLRPHHSDVEIAFGGKTLELINAPEIVILPASPPPPHLDGKQWFVDVKNLGPSTVTVVGKGSFSVQISMGETVRIVSNGGGYLRKH
jgi:hypothetical protein